MKITFEQIKEKFEKLGCSIEIFPCKEISEEFEKQFGTEILNEMFGIGYKTSNRNIIKLDISNLSDKCSDTLHSDIFSKFFKLLEGTDTCITHWYILKTQLYTIELSNDAELGTMFFLSKNCNINWFGYILINETNLNEDA